MSLSEEIYRTGKGGVDIMDWKLDDSRPIWPQLKEQLIIEIIAGRYPMGGAFPTVRELAEDAGVNRNTMVACAERAGERRIRYNEQDGRKDCYNR